ncbi:lipopolysaccharide export system permease protein [Pseudomonas duriflava]|uniref:Lipopolysaccharide export system permease protein LptF n=1 Tax=Pseudomonas duriflava TaxID=459528 RepID=A0A562QJ72_9PSED|nr:LPS export ABC transporter permease LptF [Pseudomonas duriflava]TWI56723.1 lipopolysaccharide export system permease protein [Pseudomonas duriflava]
MFLIERYVITEVLRPFLVMAGVLTFIFASYSSERYLAEAANGTLALDTVLDIVYYKVLIALEVLIPVALYVSVVLSLGRLYHDTEMTAIAASGVSPWRIYRAVLLLALPVAVGVAALSLYGRPWAYTNTYLLEQQSKTDLDVNHLQPERFNVNADNGRMILAQRIDRVTGRLQDVLIYDAGRGRTHLFRAHEAEVTDSSPLNPVLTLEQGTAYSLQRQGIQDQTMQFKTMTLRLDPTPQTDEFKRKAASSHVLEASAALSDQAELQWRQSRGLSTLLLALLAVPLSRTPPRRGRFARLLPVTAVFALVFYAGDISKSLVSNGTLPLTPGLWIVSLVMGLALLLAFCRDLGATRGRPA